MKSKEVMKTTRIKIVENILNANDQIAEENSRTLKDHQVYSINIMASAGAGKTSLILKTIQVLSNDLRIAVIEGDTAPVTIDADKVQAMGIPAVQINTGGDCHLDAPKIRSGLSQLSLTDLDLIIIENIGNLICPAAFKLGSSINVLIASIPEGDDKPYKYPSIYRGIDALILNKIDLKPYVDFNETYFKKGIEILNPGVKFFEISCKTGEGLNAWTNWLKSKITDFKNE
jgi:hydrogenase nickel incorporation protein HypB